MKKLHKIFFLFFLLIILSTFNPNNFKTYKPIINLNLFDISQIDISNNHIIPEEEIRLKLQNLKGKNIFFITKEDILNPIKSFNFLYNMEIKKKYPKTIKLKIYEEKPIGIIIKNNQKFYICKSSKLIPYDKNLKFNTLPGIFGEESEIYLVNFIKTLKKNKFPVEKVKNYYFFKVGRWDVELANDQIIKFPFKKVVESINKSNELLNREDFKKYKVIDLRISGKIITE